MALSLLARFPRLRVPSKSEPVIPADRRADFPALFDDFRVLDKEVAPVFAKYDKTALRDQNRYRRQQVVIILGSAIMTGLGGLQAVFPHQRWPGFVLAGLGVVLAGSTAFVKERASMTSYLSARIQAERLRALHFQYLSATGQYAGSGRQDAVRRAVLAIERGEEPK